jgi:hypothetical protein
MIFNSPNSDGKHKDTFDEEEPSPSLSACYASHSEYTKGNQRSDNVAVGVSAVIKQFKKRLTLDDE